jgi:hypothetical protein
LQVKRSHCGEGVLFVDYKQAECEGNPSSLADLLPNQGLIAPSQCIANFTIGEYVDGMLRYPVAPRNEFYDATDVAADIIDVTYGKAVL